MDMGGRVSEMIWIICTKVPCWYKCMLVTMVPVKLQ
jgi:hypothetical protein